MNYKHCQECHHRLSCIASQGCALVSLLVQRQANELYEAHNQGLDLEALQDEIQTLIIICEEMNIDKSFLSQLLGEDPD